MRIEIITFSKTLTRQFDELGNPISRQKLLGLYRSQEVENQTQPQITEAGNTRHFVTFGKLLPPRIIKPRRIRRAV